MAVGSKPVGRPTFGNIVTAHPAALGIERVAFNDVFEGNPVPQSKSRAWLAEAETRLWLAVVQDAKDTAVKIGRGLSLKGDDTRMGAWRRQQGAALYELLDWLVPCPQCDAYMGSLPWISDVLSSTTGHVIDVEAVRRYILAAIDNGAGARERRSRRRRRKAVVTPIGEGRQEPVVGT